MALEGSGRVVGGVEGEREISPQFSVEHTRVSLVTQPLDQFSLQKTKALPPYSGSPHRPPLGGSCLSTVLLVGLLCSGRTRPPLPFSLCFLHPRQVRSLSLDILPPPSSLSGLLGSVQAALEFRPSDTAEPTLASPWPFLSSVPQLPQCWALPYTGLA